MDLLVSYHTLIYLIAAFLFLVVLFPFIRKEVRKKKKAHELVNQIIPIAQLTETEISGIASRHPSGKKMYPAINKSICVGCGCCVLSCTSKKSIYLIEGKSTLVNPLACVCCGNCEKACPMGANQLVEHGKKMKTVVPDIDENHESNVKGIYIIGSLAGAGLIKEAINQGRAVMNHIMKDVYPDAPPQVMIIGSGPAGLSALLSCQKFGLPVTCLEKEVAANTIRNFPKKKLVMAEPVEMPLFGPLWIGHTTRERLLEVWDKILKTTKAPVTTRSRMESITRQGDRFVVTASGREHVCDKIILALGVRGEPRRLSVPGEDLPKVFYGLVDAKEFADSAVLIVGAGDSAIEAALALRNQGCRVTLVVRGDGFPKAKAKNQKKIETAAQEGKIQVLFSSAVKEIRPKAVSVAASGGVQDLENDAVFVMVGGELPFPLLEKIGIRFIEKEI